MIDVTSNIFLQLGIIIIIAAVAAYILRLIRQPQILAYVIVGILITPVFKLITDTSVIESMSIVGIAFLLFIVGLEMDLKALKNVAIVSTFGGVIQIIVLFVFGYLIALLLGFLSLEAAYIGLLLAFSSTMVVMKLLSDKREINTLHGRIIIGTLLIQDVVAIFAIFILSSLNNFTFLLLGIVLLKFLALFAVAFICGKYIFPYIFRFAARNQELLLISSLAVCFLFSLSFYYFGFESFAIGAFLAGITLGNLEYSFQIIGKIRSLRDFFALLFFVSLGMGLSLSVLQGMVLELIIILLAVILVKPFVIMLVCSLFKYTKKPAFLTASSLAQMGEFSLILAMLGLSFGHISQELYSLVVIITLLSITLTSYLIEKSAGIYRVLQKPLGIFDFFATEGLEYLPTKVEPKIVLCGHNRIGYSILQNLAKSKKKILVVDYNPEIIAKIAKKGYHCIYGDVTDEEILDRMNLNKLTLLISTVPGVNENLFLIRRLRAVNKRAEIIMAASQIEEAFKLYDQGADYVILPHFLGGEHVAQLISNVRSKKVKLKEERQKHIEHLKERKEAGHEHPET